MTLKTLQRNNYLLKTYGISLLQYNKILKKQGGGCAICGKTPEQEGRNLSVDHNHKTGEIRGLLDSYCNHRVVGRHTDPDLIQRVSDYLRQGTGWFVPEKRKRRRKKKT